MSNWVHRERNATGDLRKRRSGERLLKTFPRRDFFSDPAPSTHSSPWKNRSTHTKEDMSIPSKNSYCSGLSGREKDVSCPSQIEIPDKMDEVFDSVTSGLSVSLCGPAVEASTTSLAGATDAGTSPSSVCLDEPTRCVKGVSQSDHGGPGKESSEYLLRLGRGRGQILRSLPVRKPRGDILNNLFGSSQNNDLLGDDERDLSDEPEHFGGSRKTVLLEALQKPGQDSCSPAQSAAGVGSQVKPLHDLHCGQILQQKPLHGLCRGKILQQLAEQIAVASEEENGTKSAEASNVSPTEFVRSCSPVDSIFADGQSAGHERGSQCSSEHEEASAASSKQEGSELLRKSGEKGVLKEEERIQHTLKRGVGRGLLLEHLSLGAAERKSTRTVTAAGQDKKTSPNCSDLHSVEVKKKELHSTKPRPPIARQLEGGTTSGKDDFWFGHRTKAEVEQRIEALTRSIQKLEMDAVKVEKKNRAMEKEFELEMSELEDGALPRVTPERVKEFDRFLHAYGKSKVAAKTIVSNESRRNSFKMKYSEIFGNNELAKLELELVVKEEAAKEKLKVTKLENSFLQKKLDYYVNY